MPTVYKLLPEKQTFFSGSGTLLSGGKLYTYTAGTTTLKDTYTELDGATTNANPIVLNARGEVPNGVFGTTGAYKLVLKDASDATLWTRDNIYGEHDPANLDVSTLTSEWVASGYTPTRTGNTTFTTPGDSTAVFLVGRRIKCTDSSTIYARVSSASYSVIDALTTVTVVTDGGNLSASLSRVDIHVLADHLVLTGAELQAALNSGAKVVKLTQPLTITTQIDVPAGVTLDGQGYTVTKGANIDMFTLADSAIVKALFLQGAGATYTGRGFVISTGNDQKILGCGANDMNGYCLEFTTNDNGIRSVIDGHGGTWQRTTATNPAIKLPASDSPTVGGRTLQNIYCGGGALVDLSGGSVTYIYGCNTTAITFSSSTKAAMISQTRIAGNLTVDGSNTVLYGNEIGGNVTINGTASVVVADGNNIAGTLTVNNGCGSVRWGDTNYVLGLITDNSTAVTNKFYYDADVTPTWGADTSNPSLGNGTLNARCSRRGNFVRARITLVPGSTTAFGTGPWFFQLPAPFNLSVKRLAVGSVRATDAGTATRVGIAYTNTGAPKVYMTSDGGTADWQSNVPHTWANGDSLNLDLEWEIG